jgi:hypothetical protein
MDVIGLQGIWPTFPNATPSRVKYAIEIYHRLLKDAVAEGKRTRKYETVKQRQRRLIDEMIARITQEDEDDAFVILAV